MRGAVLKTFSVMACLLAVTACGSVKHTAATSTTQATEPFPNRDVSQSYLNVPETKSVAGQDGTVKTVGLNDPNLKTAPAHVDVLSLNVANGSTVLRLRLKGSTTDQLNPQQFSADRSGGSFSGITLTSNATNQLFKPATNLIGPTDNNYGSCDCARTPQLMNGKDGFEFSVNYGGLPNTVTTVQVDVPGFAPFDAPVNHI